MLTGEKTGMGREARDVEVDLERERAEERVCVGEVSVRERQDGVARSVC